jgi:hypothetical protein
MPFERRLRGLQQEYFSLDLMFLRQLVPCEENGRIYRIDGGHLGMSKFFVRYSANTITKSACGNIHKSAHRASNEKVAHDLGSRIDRRQSVTIGGNGIERCLTNPAASGQHHQMVLLV